MVKEVAMEAIGMLEDEEKQEQEANERLGWGLLRRQRWRK